MSTAVSRKGIQKCLNEYTFANIIEHSTIGSDFAQRLSSTRLCLLAIFHEVTFSHLLYSLLCCGLLLLYKKRKAEWYDFQDLASDVSVKKKKKELGLAPVSRMKKFLRIRNSSFLIIVK